MRTTPNDTTLYICRPCDVTKKMHPATCLSAQDTCMLCAQNIHHELFMDNRNSSRIIMPVKSFTHDRVNHTITATVGTPVERTKHRAARLCSLHHKRRQPSVPHFMESCYSCKKTYNMQFLYPLMCCNLCRMNGNCCVDFTSGWWLNQYVRMVMQSIINTLKMK